MSLRLKFIAVALICVTFTGTVLFLVSLSKGHTLISAAIETEVADSERLVLERIAAASRDALKQATVVAALPSVGQALANEDVEALKEEFIPGLDRVRAENGIGTFIFVVPPAINFLRVQNPDRRLDDISSFRPEVMTVFESRQPMHGLARGRAGLTARGLAPVVHQGQVVGLAEFGTALNGAFFQSIMDATGRHTEFYLVPSDVPSFEAVETAFDRSAATLGAEALLSTEEIQIAASEGGLRRPIDIEGQSFVATAVPLQGLNGEVVAVVNILTDTSQYRQIQSYGIWKSAIALVLTLALGSVFAVWASGRFSAQIHGLSSKMMDLAEGNLDIEIARSGDKYEIGQMTNAMVIFQENTRKAAALDLEVKENEARERARENEARAEQADREKEQREREEVDRAAVAARIEKMETFQREMERVLGEAANGNFGERMSEEFDAGELSGLAKIVNRLMVDTDQNIDDVVRCIGELSKGNLGTRIEGARHGSFKRMQEDLNSALTTLSTTMAGILSSGRNVADNSAHMQASANDMAKRAEQNAASIEETSTSIEEMTRSIEQVVQNAKSANEATANARQRANKSRAVSDETETSINAISDASDQINRIVKVIEDIAFQINLLALNAGVEAARAGDAGRGFTVVASEVRALALRSQDAVKEIGDVIAQNNQRVSVGVEKVAQSRQALQEIIEEVEAASDQISAIASAVEEQSSGISEINTSVRTIEQTAQVSAASLEEMTAASASNSGEATALATALRQFKGVGEALSPAAAAAHARAS
ncbi:MAG: methyl-accepting chemotaxis protein [Pseudomonadota bacterium]